MIAKVVLIFVNNSMRRKLKNRSLKFSQPHTIKLHNITYTSFQRIAFPSYLWLQRATTTTKNGPASIEWTHPLWVSFDFVHMLWLSPLLWIYVSDWHCQYTMQLIYTTYIKFWIVGWKHKHSMSYDRFSVGSTGTHTYIKP